MKAYRVKLSREHEPAFWTQLWDGKKPLVLGHPLRLALERSGKTEVRVRTIGFPVGTTQKHSSVSARLGAAPAELELKEVSPDLPFLLEVSKVDWGAVLTPPASTLASLRKELTQVVSPDEAKNLKRATGFASGLFAMMLLASLVMKATQKEEAPEEIIPAQYASAVLSKPAETKTAAPTQSQPKAQAQNTQVAQALSSSSVKSAMSKLLQGGMSRLLAQSDLVSARRAGVFSERSRQNALTSDTQIKTDSTQVGAVGDTKNGNYKSTTTAGLNTSGGEFVSLQDDAMAVESGLTKEEVGRVIHGHLSEIRYCYESAMVRSAHVEGKLLVDFVIGGSGVVKSAQVKQSNLGDPRLDDCIVRRLVKWKFPNPKGGVDVSVSYPFLFKTLGR